MTNRAFEEQQIRRQFESAEISDLFEDSTF